MPKSMFSDRCKVFPARLIEARRGAPLIHVDLVMRLGKPQSFAFKVETGERRLDVVEFGDCAQTVGVNELELAASVLGNPAFQRA